MARLWASCACLWLPAATASQWELHKSMVGTDFFAEGNWRFFTDPDPTKGTVKYVDRETALSSGMAKADADRVYIGTDMSSVAVGDNIPSVRLQSVETYNSGLFVIQMDHQPTGCGVWPAFWMTHEDAEHPWPTWGEADFIEGAHGQNEVWTTLHTLANCDQSSVEEGVDFTGHWMPGIPGEKPHATNCSIKAVDQLGNEGCPVEGPRGTMGKAFNDQGGGTFAFEWNPVDGYIRTFFWAPGNEPEDLKAGSPVPDGWGLPYAKFLLNEQDCPTSRFRDMQIVINTAFCGEWGDPEPAFHKACPDVPASMTCPEYVSTFAKSLTDTFWSITKLDVYQLAVDSSLYDMVV